MARSVARQTAPSLCSQETQKCFTVCACNMKSVQPWRELKAQELVYRQNSDWMWGRVCVLLDTATTQIPMRIYLKPPTLLATWFSRNVVCSMKDERKFFIMPNISGWHVDSCWHRQQPVAPKAKLFFLWCVCVFMLRIYKNQLRRRLLRLAV